MIAAGGRAGRAVGFGAPPGGGGGGDSPEPPKPGIGGGGGGGGGPGIPGSMIHAIGSTEKGVSPITVVSMRLLSALCNLDSNDISVTVCKM